MQGARPMPIDDSALVILVPEAEGLVRSFRDAYDPAAARGMPAHITLLYPFKSTATIDSAVLDALRQCFAGVAPFDFALTKAKRFPNETFYLAVEPEEPFRLLTLAIWRSFPEAPPYGGQYPTIVPHLTIADRQEARQLDEIGHEFDQSSIGKLPIRSHAAKV